MSWPPCTQSTGGFGSIWTIPDQLQNFGESAFKIPRVPGAMPGQFGEVVRSPG